MKKALLALSCWALLLVALVPAAFACPNSVSCHMDCFEQYEACKRGCGNHEECLPGCVAERSACYANCGEARLDLKAMVNNPAPGDPDPIEDGKGPASPSKPTGELPADDGSGYPSNPSLDPHRRHNL